MYSVILLCSLSTPADVPQGLLPPRGGCDGVQARPVRNLATGVRGAVANRPTPVRTLVGGVINHRREAVAARGGCSGAYASSASVDTSSAAVSITTTTTARVMPAVGGSVAAPPTVGGPFRGDRDRVERQLRRALEQSDSSMAKRALADPDVFAALAAKVSRDMSRSAMAASPGATVGAIGDGRILRLLLDNMPEILAAAKKIWEMFQ